MKQSLLKACPKSGLWAAGSFYKSTVCGPKHFLKTWFGLAKRRFHIRHEDVPTRNEPCQKLRGILAKTCLDIFVYIIAIEYSLHSSLKLNVIKVAERTSQADSSQISTSPRLAQFAKCLDNVGLSEFK